MHRAELHARPALVVEIDRRGVGLARDLHARFARGLHLQESVVEQGGFQIGLALLVYAMIEWLAFVRLEAPDGALDRRELRRFAFDRYLLRDDLDLLAGGDSKQCSQFLIGRLQGARDLGVVITVRFERGAQFALGVIEEAAHLGRGDVAIGVVLQGELAFHGLRQLLGQPLDFHGERRGPGGSRRPRQQHRNQPAHHPRAAARPWRSSLGHWTVMVRIAGSSVFFGMPAVERAAPKLNTATELGSGTDAQVRELSSNASFMSTGCG